MKARICKQCGTRNDFDARFCKECGAMMGNTDLMDMPDVAPDPGLVIDGAILRKFDESRAKSRDITIPNGVKIVGDDAFKGCTTLERVVIPDTCILLANSCFEGCTSLKEAVIGDAVRLIGGNAFKDCSALKRLFVGSGIMQVESCAFKECHALNEVQFMGTIAEWCDITFADSSANPLSYAHNLSIDGDVVSDLVIPDGVKEIKKYAFDGCSCLTTLVVADSVTTIGHYAFGFCTYLFQVDLGNGVSWIQSNAFNKCAYLHNIYLPSSVTKVDEYAFGGFNYLTIDSALHYQPGGFNAYWNRRSATDTSCATVNWGVTK